jgi:hypothetical protein
MRDLWKVRCLTASLFDVPRSVWFVSTIDGSQRHSIAAYIASVARTFRDLDAQKAELYKALCQPHTPRVNRKSLREECWFVWHSFTRTGKGKYSPTLPWSPRAIEARRADPKASLVVEHVEPFALFCERLEALADGPIEDVERLLSDIQLVVIMADEDAAVSAAGYRNRLPNSNNPWDRYQPAGLTRDRFRIPATGERLAPSTGAVNVSEPSRR